MKAHHETPTRRRNPKSGWVWIARYTNPAGQRLSAGTFKLKRDAQDAIDAAYSRPASIETVGAYAATWTSRHPRSKRTNQTNDHRISRLLDVRLEGRELRYWLLADLRRRHANDLVAHMLTVQGRSPSGAVDILRAFSAMCEDAITDELAVGNAFKGVRVRTNDPRATKQAREPRVFSLEELHAFAGHARNLRKGDYEPMVRTLIDCGLRLGECLGLERRDLQGGDAHVPDSRKYPAARVLQDQYVAEPRRVSGGALLSLRGNAHNGQFTAGDTPTKRHVRTIPVPPTLSELLRAMPKRIDTLLLFPTVRGRIWWEENWRRDIWIPTQKAAGINPTPHECRHSWCSHLRAEGVDPADLASMAGHSVLTASSRYVHALHRSHDAVRGAIG